MATNRSVFWDDLESRLSDPEFKETYDKEYIRVTTVDRIVNALNDALAESGMSKAELASRTNQDAATLRRLLSTRNNPTIGTLAPVADALGLEITVSPIKPKPAKAARKRSSQRSRVTA